MNYWLERLPAIREYVFLLSTLLVAVTPVLGKFVSNPKVTPVLGKFVSSPKVTPVLRKCGISGCCGLRCNKLKPSDYDMKFLRRYKLKPNDYDIELTRNVSQMFEVDVFPCPLCAEEDQKWISFVAVKDYDDEQAMDDLYGKIGLKLHGVIKKEEGIGVGILCRRFLVRRKWLKWRKKKRIGCFIYRKEAYKPKSKKS
ncbi:unnamed protein product [Cylicocyclus nassatus]|uniref:Uncharacterized protein n=1 Tax=Cylicocyclus nassatus TaxID=53992 RepID=A0AA36DIL3_CYLNA|nr:unnamed protein product [Cylicocyclus nassatus]